MIPVIVAPPSDCLNGDRVDAQSENHVFYPPQPKADQWGSNPQNNALLYSEPVPAVYSDYHQPIVAYAPA